MSIKNFFLTTFTSKKAAFYLNLFGLTLAFSIFYVLMAEVKWVNGFDTFHKDADRIYRLYNNLLDENTVSPDFCVPLIKELMEYSSEVEHSVLVTHNRWGYIVPADSTTESENINADFCYVTKDLPNVFTFTMIEGDTASLADPRNALIPVSLAEKIYGKGQPCVGRIFGDGKSWFLKVGGVYQDFPTNSIVGNVVYQSMDEDVYKRYLSNNGEWSYACYVRLKKEASPDKVYKNFLRDHEDNFGYNNEKEKEEFLNKHNITLYPLHEIFFLPQKMNGKDGSHYINILFLILACLTVLIAGINYMNFSMAMIPYRIKSINVQKILGASQLSLRLSLLFETFLTILIALGMALGLLSILIKGGYLDDYLKCDIAFNKNTILLVYLGILVFLLTLFSGLYPAYYVTSRKPALVINGNFALSETGRTFRKGLIGVQFTISLVVIMVMLLMNSQSYYMRNSPVGYARDSILYLQAQKMIRINNYEAFMNKLRSNPDIENVAWCNTRLGESDVTMGWGRRYENRQIFFSCYPVQPNFLRTMGIKVTEGRDFREEDTNKKEGVLIFNETAKRILDLKLNTNINNAGEIIGFIPDIKSSTFRNEVTPMAFFVWGTENWGIRDYNCAIRVSTPDKMPEVRRFVESVYKELSGELEQPQIYTKNEIAGNAYKEEDQQIQIVLFGSVISLIISIIGVFGLTLFETQAKRKEIGLRKVFGASTGSILLMFNKHYLKIIATCFIIAVPISYYLYSMWLEGFAYRTTLQWWLFAVAFLIVVIVVCCTVTIQSWKAARELPVNVIHK